MPKFIVFIVISFSLFAQNPWQVVTQASLLETSSSPDEIFFLNENKGWLGGQMGIIYYTNDGGNTWTIQRDTSSSQPTINDIFFLDDNHGWACGADGNIIYTTDGGVTWTEAVNTSTTEALNAITFVNNNYGYACGNNGVIIKTTNGGLNWVLQITNVSSNLGGISFWDVNKGFAIINSNANGVLWTNSGGFVWSVTLLPIPAGAASARMYGCDAVLGTTEGWIAGYHGLIFKTTNSGQTWSLSANFYGSEYKQTRDIDFFDSQIGYAGGYSGDIFRTTNGGTTWDTLNAGTNQTIVDVSTVSNQTVFTAGIYSQLRKSTDSGITWIPMVDWPRVSFRGIGIADSLNITACSFGGDISYSSDAGQNFSFPGNNSNPHNGNVFVAYFINANIGFLAGQNAEISKTTNGGNTWVAANVSGTELSTIYSMSFSDINTGWAGASSGNIYKTTDGGNNWNLIHSISGEIIYDMYFVDSQVGFVATNQGNIYKCTDGNTNWTLMANYPDVNFYSLEFVNATHSIAAGTNGFVVQSYDGGNTWSITDTLNFKIGDSTYVPDLRDITFINSNEGWIVGEDGATFYTPDTGQTWQYMDSKTQTTLYEVEFLSPTYGYITGGDGTILKYDQVSSIFEIYENNLPNQVQLKSNYPNPFNPTTNIEYYINVGGNAELSIFNINGQKIRTLIKEYQKPGNYNFIWDAKSDIGNRVSSGIYFYQLKIDNEIRVKRMLLIK